MPTRERDAALRTGGRPPLALRIERLVAGGDGLARLPDGRVCFVPGTAPGELVSARLVEERGDFARAALAEVLEPSPGRRTPPCPHAAECGGCPWLHLDYPTQLAAKTELLREALRRTGGIEWPGEIPVHPSPETAHRDRVRWKAAAGKGGVHIGFHAPRSHRVVDVRSCLCVPPGAAERLSAWRAILGPRAGAIRSLEELVHDVEEPDAGLLTLHFPRRAPGRPEALGPLAEKLLGAGGLRGVAAVVPGRRGPLPLAGEPEIVRRTGGLSFRLHGGVFFQVNAALRGTLQERVAALAGEGARCLDLFCGAGFLSLRLARRFGELLGIESGSEAVRLARANAEDNRILNARFEEGDAGAWLEAAAGFRPDVVVADPPRSGLGPAAARRLAALGQARTVLVACDPVGLARDLRPFLETGHALRAVEILDLFPGTPHLEALALLERG